MTMKEKQERIIVEVSGADQDEALAKAEALAKEKGYARVSLQNIVEVTYTAMLFQPTKPIKK